MGRQCLRPSFLPHLLCETAGSLWPERVPCVSRAAGTSECVCVCVRGGGGCMYD